MMMIIPVISNCGMMNFMRWGEIASFLYIIFYVDLFQEVLKRDKEMQEHICQLS
jgi:hypothetical protein